MVRLALGIEILAEARAVRKKVPSLSRWHNHPAATYLQDFDLMHVVRKYDSL
jgi:hypothetical protein